MQMEGDRGPKLYIESLCVTKGAGTPEPVAAGDVLHRAASRLSLAATDHGAEITSVDPQALSKLIADAHAEGSCGAN